MVKENLKIKQKQRAWPWLIVTAVLYSVFAAIVIPALKQEGIIPISIIITLGFLISSTYTIVAVKKWNKFNLHSNDDAQITDKSVK